MCSGMLVLVMGMLVSVYFFMGTVCTQDKELDS